MDLEFITVLNPKDDKASANRTRVKKHVMKGIGRDRRKPRKNPTIFDIVLSPQSAAGSCSVDPFVPFPFELGKPERALVAYSKFHRNLAASQFV